MIYVGKEVQLEPVSLDTKNELVTGIVTYIHPRGRFYTVLFKLKNGTEIRENFPFTNEEMLELIDAGVVKLKPEPYISPPEHVTSKELTEILLREGIDKSAVISLGKTVHP